MKLTGKELGKWGEQAAACFLTAHGYQILETNFRTPYGEIDIITQKGGVIVFVEVKTRSSSSLGTPEISVTPRKQKHMIQSALFYIQQHPQDSGIWRIDVIAVRRMKPGHAPEITYFENAVS